MPNEVRDAPADGLDTSDIDRFIGRPLARSGPIDPIGGNDIRRWVQAMHHPNRLYLDPEFAEESRFGRLVAPQSFAIACVYGHGARPAAVGNVPESHMLFGGDEWWFFGPRIFPGDRIFVDQMPFDYRVSDTRFAGPTLIQRGDNHYVNDRGEKIATQRSTMIRYRPDDRPAADFDPGATEEPQWTDDALAQIVEQRRAYLETIHGLGHERRNWSDVSVDDELPVSVMGPHSVASFATEWRAYIFTSWNSMHNEEYMRYGYNGSLEEMTFPAGRDWDPEFHDGAYYGNARGHLFGRYARRIGMPRPYGYGASMGSWVTDYLSSWAGEWGFVRHLNVQYRGPVLSGDVTYLRGTVTAKAPVDDGAGNMVSVECAMTNQRDEVIAKGTAEVQLP